MAGQVSNSDVVGVLQEIADILEVKGENRYRILGYRRGAESILNLGRDINDIWQEGGLQEIPGVGEALSGKIDELLRTGQLAYLERLRQEVPPG